MVKKRWDCNEDQATKDDDERDDHSAFCITE